MQKDKEINPTHKRSVTAIEQAKTSKLDAIKKHIPFIESLCVDGLQKRHIERINKVFAVDNSNVVDQPWSFVKE